MDYDFYHFPRLNRAGGGTGVFLRKGFSVHKNDTPIFTSMECIDLTIKPDSRSSIRLITVYRPTRSQKNRATVSTFFNEFSLLLESVNLTPGYLLINGDLNFHMDVSDNVNASAFLDLLESAELKQNVSFRTHRSVIHWILSFTDRLTTYWLLFLPILTFPPTIMLSSALSLFKDPRPPSRKSFSRNFAIWIWSHGRKIS